MGMYINLGHTHFVPYTFQFISHATQYELLLKKVEYLPDTLKDFDEVWYTRHQQGLIRFVFFFYT